MKYTKQSKDLHMEKYHKSEYGYFIQQSDGWKFLPFETFLDENNLLDILNTLKVFSQESQFDNR